MSETPKINELELTSMVSRLAERAMVEGQTEVGEILSCLFVCMHNPTALSTLHTGVVSAYQEMIVLNSDFAPLPLDIEAAGYLLEILRLAEKNHLLVNDFIEGISDSHKTSALALYLMARAHTPPTWAEAWEDARKIPPAEVATKLTTDADLGLYLRVGLRRLLRQHEDILRLQTVGGLPTFWTDPE